MLAPFLPPTAAISLLEETIEPKGNSPEEKKCLTMKKILSPMLAAFFLSLIIATQAGAEQLVNQDAGFSITIPSTWLRWEGGIAGTKVASERVRMKVEPYRGVSQAQLAERLIRQAKEQRYEIRSQKSTTVNYIPTQEIITIKDRIYKIYYVLIAGDKGYLWTIESPDTDSPAYLEGQGILSSFTVL